MMEELLSQLGFASVSGGSVFAFGFEDDEDEEDAEEEESEDEDEDEEEGDEDEEDEDEDPPKKTSTAGLKSALRKERVAARTALKAQKRLQKELDALKGVEDKDKAKEENKKAADSEKTRKESEAAVAKSEKLSAKLLTNAVDTAIIKAAGSIKGVQFKDVDDVLKLIDRAELDVDQDDDDPSEVKVDGESVTDALKALAKKKPHLLVQKSENDEGTGGGGGTRSGSKFGGKKDKDKASEEALRKKYPALGRR